MFVNLKVELGFLQKRKILIQYKLLKMCMLTHPFNENHQLTDMKHCRKIVRCLKYNIGENYIRIYCIQLLRKSHL